MLGRVENTFSLNYPVELLELPEQKIHIERILRMIAKHSELIDMKFGVGETVLSYNEELLLCSQKLMREPLFWISPVKKDPWDMLCM